MKIRQFTATRLNHLSNLNVEFQESLTFITGVNGSGKTSVLSAIVALLSPNFDALASLNFERIEVAIEIGNRLVKIAAETINDVIKLTVRPGQGSFEFRKFEEDQFGADPEARLNYYNALRVEGGSNRVLSMIDDIPTPMFLGLDRRYRGSAAKRSAFLSRRIARRRKRNVFGLTIADSLMQAIALAEDQYSLVQSQTAMFRSEFVRELLLSLLTVSPTTNMFSLQAPTAADRELVATAQKALLKFPRVEGITADAVRSRVDPIIAGITEVLNQIPEDFNSKAEMKDEKQRHVFDAIIRWNGYKATLEQITKVSDLISSYNERVNEAGRDLDKYLRLIDEFLGQTGKSLGFDAHGTLSVRTPKQEIGVEDLSSGEAQILVVLTHLAFNPDAQNAGVILIDEPELSLHITWQEMLVSSMLKANSTLQYILATHSPSVLIDRMDCATDLSKYAFQA